MQRAIISRRGGALTPAQPVGASAPGSTVATEPYPPASPLPGVRWTFGYAALLFYIFVITTYRIQAGTLAMCLALAGLLFQRQAIQLPAMLRWMGALLLWSAAGYAVSAYPGVVWDNVLEEGKLWIIAFVIVNSVRSRAQLRFFLIFSLGCFALYPVRGALFSFFIYGGTVMGRAAWNYIYSNPNDLAAFCLLQLSLAAGVLVTERRGWIRRAAFAGVVILPFLILLTQSRGAIIALAIFGLLVVRKTRMRLGRLVWVVVLGGVVVLFLPSSVWQRIELLRNATSTSTLQEVDPEGSAQQRFEIMKVAAAIGLDNPIFGAGRGTYKLVHEQYAMQPEFDPIARGQRDTHDTYLNVFAETGLVGLTFFLLMIGTTVAAAERARRSQRRQQPRAARQLLLLEFGLFAYLIAGIFGTFGHLTFTYVHLAIIAVMARELENREYTPAFGRRGGGRRVVSPLHPRPQAAGALRTAGNQPTG